MTEKEFKNIFNKVIEANSIEKLIEIEEFNEFQDIQKNRIDEVKYPKINFTISNDDINQLINSNLLIRNNEGISIDSSKLENPISKLLYSLAWKNGDLLKLNHIIEGIQDSNNEADRDKGIVFHQFGKFLSSPKEPIIDQHVIRAFVAFKSKDSIEFENATKIKTIDKRNSDIKEYKDWLKKLNIELQNKEAYYWVDRILFALGKTIKK